MPNPERKQNNSNPEVPGIGLMVTINTPDSIHDLAIELAVSSQGDRGEPKWSVISKRLPGAGVFFHENTSIGVKTQNNITRFECVTAFQPSEPVKPNEDYAFFTDDKKIQLMRGQLAKRGLNAEIEEGASENVLFVDFGNLAVKISLGSPNAELQRTLFPDNPGGHKNKFIILELVSPRRFKHKSQLKLDQFFNYYIQTYAYVYESLINAIYQYEGINLPKMKVVLQGKDVNRLNPNDWEGFDMIMGQDEAIHEAKKLVLAVKHPEAYKKRGVKIPKGILLYGPPGTGKTTLAKSIAHESGARFIEVSIADIVGKYHGESEKNMQEIFDNAKSGGRTILFFDEFDSLAPPRDESYEVTRKIIAVFNQNMDGMRSNPNVTVIAATNRPEGIDSAAKRSGRFDKIIEMGLPDGKGRVGIFKKEMAKAMRLSPEPKSLFSPELDFERIARETNGLSGADIANLVNRVLEDKLFNEFDGKVWTPVSTEEVLDLAYKMIIERTEKVEVKFGRSL